MTHDIQALFKNHPLPWDYTADSRGTVYIEDDRHRRVPINTIIALANAHHKPGAKKRYVAEGDWEYGNVWRVYDEESDTQTWIVAYKGVDAEADATVEADRLNAAEPKPETVESLARELIGLVKDVRLDRSGAIIAADALLAKLGESNV